MQSLTWSDAPQEILQKIVSHLNNNTDSIQCQLTCKIWSRPAQKQLYEWINLDHMPDDKVALFFQIVSTSDNSPGKLVKTMYVGDYFSKDNTLSERNPISLDYFTNLHLLLPNLKQILGDNVEEVFWTKLMHARYNGHWQSLIHIPSSSPKALERYACAAVACCSTLRSLTLQCYQPFHGRCSSHINMLTQNLKHFTNLKHLEIKFSENDGSIFEYDSAIQDCRSLTTIRIFYTRNPSPGTHNIAQKNQQQNMDKCKHRPLIRCFTGIDCINDNSSAMYFIHTFTNLKWLMLWMKSWNKFIFTRHVMKKLFQLILKIPRFRISFAKDLNQEDKLILAETFINTTEGAGLTININYYASIVPSPVAINFWANAYARCRDGIDCISYNSRTHCYWYKIYFQNGVDTIHQHKNFLQKYSARIQEIHYNADAKLITPAETNLVAGLESGRLRFDSLYDTIIQEYLFLRSLIISNINLPAASLVPCSSQSSITRLEFNHCSFLDYPDALTALSVQLPALKYLVLNKCILNSQIQRNNNVDEFNMPQASLESMTISAMGSLPVYLKVKTDGDVSKYFSMVLGQYHNNTWNMLSSGIEYDESLKKDTSYSISVTCKKISHFIVRLEDGTDQTLNLD